MEVSRKEKRKALKKEKRKQIRKELAEKARTEEEARLNDPQVQRHIQLEEEREKERLQRERKEFEERETLFLQQLQTKPLQQIRPDEGSNEDDDEWEYVAAEGLPEIIWQGNEIIVNKNKVKVKKKDINQDIKQEDPNRPTSNPLPPQHEEAYASFKNAPMTSATLLDTVAQQLPNFGTEQDKAHCPFHIKTGACRFGSHCNRVHYYPDKSNTLLIKNMYNGPGLAWEQDEGLEVCCWLQAVILNFFKVHGGGSWFEDRSFKPQAQSYAHHSLFEDYTEEEVERSYEDFYEDVHTEFLKFGEIINFKVCRNGSFHLRGNVYVHYKSLESAVMAYGSVHGRYFAGKQVKCEFVSLTRWKVAICGEYMKSRLKTCSRGSACNFLHCFNNPGGDYEWADCDKPPPRYWVNKMTALFGYSYQPSPKGQQHPSRIFTSSDRDSYHSKGHRSIDSSQRNGSSGRSHHEETHARKNRHRSRKEDHNVYEDETEYNNKSNYSETDSDGDRLDRKRHDDRSENRIRKESKPRDNRRRTPGSRGGSSDEDLHTKRKSRHRKNISESLSNDAKPGLGEGELLRHTQETKSSSRRSRHDYRDEVDHEESKKVEARSQHRPRRRSHESEPKSDTSDRWQPHDYEISDEREPKGTRIDHGTRLGGVVEDALKDIQQSRDRDDRKREKRKRI